MRPQAFAALCLSLVYLPAAAQEKVSKVKGPLTKESIADVVHEHRKQIRACNSARKTPDLAGKVTVNFVIALDGAVSSATIANSTLTDGALESCVLKAIRNWRFPRPKKGVVEVNFPFTFGPERSADAGTQIQEEPRKVRLPPPDFDED